MFDVVIIGCGIIGASAAYELSKYDVKVAVLEKENDVANHTTKANSAIVHAGYDPEPNTLMAKLNVKGSSMIEELSKKLSVDYKKIGSFVLAFDEEDVKTIEKLYERGIKNGVPGIEIISGEKACEMEPNLSKNIKAALYAPSAAIISPWDLCIAMADTAVNNGVQVFLSTTVSSIDKDQDGFIIHTNNEDFRTKYIINAAGVHSDEIHDMVGEPEYKTVPNRGQYYMLDKSQGRLVNKVIFQCPTKSGKGVLVAPTVHGNLIVGPNAEDIDERDDVATTRQGLEYVWEAATKSVPDISLRESIRNFSGVRAHTDLDDFIIEESKTAKGFINLAGIKSPGLSSAPAIGEMAVDLLKSIGLELNPKDGFCDTRKKIRFKDLSIEEKKELIFKNPLYGRVICRCETVTEGEIVDALHSPIVPRTIDAVKRRCGAGMGRCQGGFCGPRVQEIIARELNIPMEDVLMNKEGSVIITGETKTGGAL